MVGGGERRAQGGMGAMMAAVVALCIVVEPAVSLSCLQSRNGTAAVASVNCSAGVVYCYSFSPSLPSNATISSQGCFVNVTGVTCPVSGGGQGTYAATGGKYTCCNSTNCNTAANTTSAAAAAAAASPIINNQTDEAAFKFGSNLYIPKVYSGSFGIATYIILGVLAAVGVLGGLLVDMAATDRFPFKSE